MQCPKSPRQSSEKTRRVVSNDTTFGVATDVVFEKIQVVVFVFPSRAVYIHCKLITCFVVVGGDY